MAKTRCSDGDARRAFSKILPQKDKKGSRRVMSPSEYKSVCAEVLNYTMANEIEEEVKMKGQVAPEPASAVEPEPESEPESETPVAKDEQLQYMDSHPEYEKYDSDPYLDEVHKQKVMVDTVLKPLIGELVDALNPNHDPARYEHHAGGAWANIYRVLRHRHSIDLGAIIENMPKKDGFRPPSRVHLATQLLLIPKIIEIATHWLRDVNRKNALKIAQGDGRTIHQLTKDKEHL